MTSNDIDRTRSWFLNRILGSDIFYPGEVDLLSSFSHWLAQIGDERSAAVRELAELRCPPLERIKNARPGRPFLAGRDWWLCEQNGRIVLEVAPGTKLEELANKLWKSDSTGFGTTGLKEIDEVVALAKVDILALLFGIVRGLEIYCPVCDRFASYLEDRTNELFNGCIDCLRAAKAQRNAVAGEAA